MSNDLKHWGVLGMHWGQRRMGPTGVVTTTRKGQRVPAMTTVRGKPTVVNAKAASNSIKERLAKALGMRKAPETKAILDEANRILNNPKSTKEELDRALSNIGIDPKTGKQMRTKPVYDKDGNDVSVNPMARIFRKENQSDKEYDAELANESTPQFIAKQKVQDVRDDQESRKQTIAMLATVGTVLAVKYVVMNQIQKAVQQRALEKYGPVIYNMMDNIR